MIRNKAITIILLVGFMTATAFGSQEKELFESGIDHLRKHQYEAAIEVFTDLIELTPDNPDAYKNRGVAYMKLSQYDPAIQDFEKTKQLMPDLKGLHSNLGVAWYYKGEYKKAIENYDMEISLSPESYYVYFNRAISWAELKEYDKSLGDISRTVELAPDFYLAYCLEGDLYLELEDKQTARAAYEKALQKDPGGDYARNQLEKLNVAPVVKKSKKSGMLKKTDLDQSDEQTVEQTAEQVLSGSTTTEETAAEAPPPDHEYEIQTGAFQVEKNALGQLNKLHEMGYDARILTVTRPNKVTWYLVRTGAFPDRNSADQAMAQFVKKTGMKVYVRPWDRF